ncbi:hypothetical protein NL676_013471 [Syzygium grande]|nr:hypothetical protein NL676_013471 [Syzygium grande]
MLTVSLSLPHEQLSFSLEEPRLRHHAGPPPAAPLLGTTDAAASDISVRWPKDIPQRERESSPRPPTVTDKGFYIDG